ncbi:substrate-binding periplasmic protein [Chitinimonas lacunae]|uniref:Substrate-binding periplasmic protein n=1 Tax=Chitinimonas lacunae TaxID=1963018 RepID=A0ABV8MQC3_9NEIS
MGLGKRFSWCWLLLSLCCLSFAEPVTSPPQVHLVTSAYPPYFGPDLPNQGIISEIVTEAYRRAGYRAKLEFLPWTRCLAYARTGQVDGLFGVWYLKERESFLLYSDPMPPIQLGFYTKVSSNIRYKTLEDLRRYVIGTVQDYGDPPHFVAARLNTDVAPTDKHNLAKLHAGRVDLILIERGVARHLIATEMPELQQELTWIEPPVATMQQYVALSKKSPRAEQLRQAFNKGLREMSNDGTLQRLLESSNIL